MRYNRPSDLIRGPVKDTFYDKQLQATKTIEVNVGLGQMVMTYEDLDEFVQCSITPVDRWDIKYYGLVSSTSLKVHAEHPLDVHSIWKYNEMYFRVQSTREFNSHYEMLMVEHMVVAE